MLPIALGHVFVNYKLHTLHFLAYNFVLVQVIRIKHQEMIENREVQWVKKVRTQLLHSYVVTLFSNKYKIRTSACRALILFLQNHRMSKVSKLVCYAIVACLDPAHSTLIDASFSRKSVKSLRKTLNSAKTRHLSAYCAQDVDMLQ